MSNYVLVVVFCFIAFINGTMYTSMAPFFSLMATEKGLTAAEIGVILGSFAASQLMCYPVIGLLASRVSARKSILFSLFLSVLRSLVLSRVSDCPSSDCVFWWTMGMQVSEGLAASLSMTAIMSTLIREFGDQAVTYQNAVESIGSAGAMAGPVVSGLAFHAWGFPGPFLVTASAYAAALIASGILFACRPTAEQTPLEESATAEDAEAPSGGTSSCALRHLLTDSGVRLCILIEVTENLNIAFVYGCISLFLAQMDVHPTGASAVIAIPLVFSLLIIYPFNKWMEEMHERRKVLIMVAAFFLSAMSFLASGPMYPLSEVVTPSIAWVVVSQVLLGVSCTWMHVGSMMIGMTSLRHMGISPESEAEYNTAFAAAFHCAYSLGEALGPVLGGKLVSISSYSVASSVMFVLQLVMVFRLCVHWLSRRRDEEETGLLHQRSGV